MKIRIEKIKNKIEYIIKTDKFSVTTSDPRLLASISGTNDIEESDVDEDE